jgi:hypothetical protein
VSHGDCSQCEEPLLNGEGYCDDCVDKANAWAKNAAYLTGAAAAFGLMGMAEAIWQNSWMSVPQVSTRSDTATVLVSLSRGTAE